MEMAVLFAVFGLLLNRGADNFAPFLLIGVLTWKWMANSVLHASKSILDHRELINRVHLPKIILPSIVVLTASFKFMIVFVMLVAFVFILGFPAGFHHAALLLVLLTELLFILGLSFFFASVVPFFPDIRILLANIFRLLFFLSGIFYGIDSVPEIYRSWFYLNPMVRIIESYRAVMLNHQWPDFSALAWIAILSTVLILAGARIMHKYERVYPRIAAS